MVPFLSSIHIMNSASADVFVAFLIYIFDSLDIYYVGAVSLSVYGGLIPAA